MKSTIKKNIVIIIIAAVLAIGAGVGAVAIGVSNSPANRVSRYMGAAERYLLDMNYEQAIIEFDRILEIDPMNVEAYLGKAQAYLALGDTESALEWLEKGFEMTGDKRLQDKIDEINNKPETPEESSSSVPVESEPEEIPQYEHDEVANMLLNYFNGTGDVDKEMLKSIKTFGVKPSGFDVALHSEDDISRCNIIEQYVLDDNKFFTECPINSFEKMDIISDMTNCETIFVDGFTIDDYSIFSGLKDLRLNLYRCGITDVTPISKLTNIKSLSLDYNQITDVSPLANSTHLNFLSLQCNEISDISPLANLTNLTGLWLGGNSGVTPADEDWIRQQLPNCDFL